MSFKIRKNAKKTSKKMKREKYKTCLFSKYV